MQQLPELQSQMYNFLIRNIDANIYSQCWSNKMSMLLEAGDGSFGKLWIKNRYSEWEDQLYKKIVFILDFIVQEPFYTIFQIYNDQMVISFHCSDSFVHTLL